MGKIIITRSVHQRMPPTKEAVKFKIIIIIIIIIIVIIIIIMLIIIIIIIIIVLKKTYKFG